MNKFLQVHTNLSKYYSVHKYVLEHNTLNLAIIVS